MKQDGKRSEDTIRLYLRSFRAIYQFAVEKGYVEGENPFSHIEGQTLASTRRKNASLTEDELNKILSYEPKNNIQAFGKDFFILSLQLSGANIGDILRLRNSNVKGETVQFVRTKAQKTAITTIVPLTTQARALLEKYGKINPELQDELILPYLHGCDSDKKIDERIHGILRKINRGIAQICQVIGIRKITTNYARHTYASLAMSSGMTAEQIQKFLGHASSRTTQIYLDSLNKEVIEKNRELLENMK
jgi:integrase/recombinase XerD